MSAETVATQAAELAEKIIRAVADEAGEVDALVLNHALAGLAATLVTYAPLNKQEAALTAFVDATRYYAGLVNVRPAGTVLQ